MTHPIFICRGIGLPCDDEDGAMSEAQPVPLGAPDEQTAAEDWVRLQIHPKHGSISHFKVEATPHDRGIDGPTQTFGVTYLNGAAEAHPWVDGSDDALDI